MSLSEMWDDLEEHVAPDPDTAEAAFTIDTLEKADWAVRRIGRERRKLAEARELAGAQRARIDEWEQDQVNRCATATGYLEELLVRYHVRALDEDPKAKTIRLPSGELVARKSPDSLIVDGGDDTIEWAEANAPELVVTKQSIDRARAKQRLGRGEQRPEGVAAIDPTTGEVVPGVWFQIGQVQYSVNTDTGS